MAFKLENFGAEIANAKGTLGGVCYYRYFNENGDTLTNSGYFQANLGLEVGDRIRVIPATNTDPDEIYIVTSTANRTVVVKQVDTDGVVDSVNGKTGAVVLGAQDVGAVPQYSSMPQASEDELGNIYQFTGTTDANYTNGYFYKCVSDGQDPATYSWSQVSVQPAPSGLPDQTGQSGKFLTTDGTDASWGTINALQNTATGTESLGILNNQSGNYNTVVGVRDTDFGGSANGATTLGYKAVVSSSSEGAVAIGRQAKVGHNNTSDGGIAIGYLSSTTYGGLSSANAICIGKSSHATGSRSLAIGSQAVSGAAGAIQLGGTSTSAATTNSDANTFKVANANGNFEIMSADGTIPAARHASLPAADGTYVLKLVIASGVPTLSWVAE